MDEMDRMEDRTPEGGDTGARTPWAPFPVTAGEFEDFDSWQGVRIGFPSRASLDQCVEALGGVARRTLGPYADSCAGILDGLGDRADALGEFERELYSMADGSCAVKLRLDEVAQLLLYLTDMVLLLDAGMSFDPST